MKAAKQTRPFCPHLIKRENNTWGRVDMELLFQCSTRYLLSESNERVRYRAREYKLL